MEEIEEKVIAVISKSITLDSNIEITVNMQLSELPFDSIKFIKMVVSWENEFNFEFDDEKLLFAQFPTVKSIVEYINLKTN